MRLGVVLALVCALFIMAAPAAAQTGVLQSDHLAWDQAAPTLAQAQAYVYQVYVDGGAAQRATNVQCAGTSSPFQCTGTPPALTFGVHSLTLTTSEQLTDGRLAESPASVAFQFRVVSAPATATNVRITK